MASELHGDGPPADAHAGGGDQTRDEPCPLCGGDAPNLGQHLRSGCDAA